MLSRLRSHFEAQAVLEVETPILSSAGTTDPNIDSAVIQCGVVSGYAHTSPEFAMKRLLADGCGDCYQIARVFRAGEQGARHNPEFTLLEWYRLGFSLADIAEDTVAVLSAAFGRELSVRRLGFRAACREFGNFDPFECDVDTIRRALVQGNIPLPAGLGLEETDGWIDFAFSMLVAPQFQPDEVTLVSGYPPSQASLAALGQDDNGTIALRVEAYIGPLELANGFEELRDASEQAERFEDERAVRLAAGQHAPPLDTRLIAALDHGLPPCAGMAVGLDRVLMAMLALDDISSVMNFPWGRA